MANLKLWKTSGHFDFYKEGMFDQMDVEGDEYQIKPMNCPFHCLIYKDDLRSYRCEKRLVFWNHLTNQIILVDSKRTHLLCGELLPNSGEERRAVLLLLLQSSHLSFSI